MTQTDGEAVLKEMVEAATTTAVWVQVDKDVVFTIAAHVDHLQSALKESIRLQGEYAAEVERLKGALERLASNGAFYVATSNIDPEAGMRMLFAENILKGMDLKAAGKDAESRGMKFIQPPELRERMIEINEQYAASTALKEQS